MAGNAQQAADEPITDINVTPLVDICLVLVIIFMAIAPLAMVTGVSVLHSHGKAAVGKTSLAESVKVKLTLSGRLTVNGVPVAPAALAQSISAALLRCKDKTVMVTADAGNRVGQVVEILDTAKLAGAAKVAILKPESGAAAPARGG